MIVRLGVVDLDGDAGERGKKRKIDKPAK